ncbi:tetratricopeptide repeat protein [Cronbergia sp. UHCC 0137]|uniref:tetratricopeptide repeat protein n=1 Tax=Cronbergia sp. UHCC 0137 TaxID=3110239 RepID=UPI002B2178B6|nr:tetratricopeptide repeat protein [Cronbergia sp. UHCC 0137]MEA5619586.1 tetratricopeptide repeat protein [Cronbergia sp. UHCC 0137]
MLEIIGLLMTGFWLLMIYDCVRNEPERQTWLWILLFVNVPGALIYFLARWIYRNNIPLPNYFSRWTRKRELWLAQAEAKNIGKAHQYVILGNLLTDMGIFDQAEVAYQQALEKEPNHPQALWGAALIDIKNKKFVPAKEYLQTLLKIEPDYKYGDASLVYGQTLFNLQELDQAKAHLEIHLKNWSHPEGYITLAKTLAQQGETQAASNYLETMITKIRGSSYYHYKRNSHFIHQGEKLIKNLNKIKV